jgi:type III secretion protein J
VTPGTSVSIASANPRSRRGGARLAALLLGALLAGCKSDLYVNLDQRQANEITATLINHGISAQRVAAKNGRITVTVDEERLAEAVDLLKEIGLPKQEFATMGDIFKKDGLVSSPVQERAQMIFALSQELSRTVSEIDGVLTARVHLVLPENDPLRQQLVPSSASVFVRHRADAPIGNLMPQIKMLVANGISGLSYDKVSVVLVPVEVREPTGAANAALVSFHGLWVQRDSLTAVTWIFYGLAGLVLLLAGALGALLLRQREQIYSLARAEMVKPS